MKKYRAFSELKNLETNRLEDMSYVLKHQRNDNYAFVNIIFESTDYLLVDICEVYKAVDRILAENFSDYDSLELRLDNPLDLTKSTIKMCYATDDINESFGEKAVSICGYNAKINFKQSRPLYGTDDVCGYEAVWC